MINLNKSGPLIGFQCYIIDFGISGTYLNDDLSNHIQPQKVKFFKGNIALASVYQQSLISIH